MYTVNEIYDVWKLCSSWTPDESFIDHSPNIANRSITDEEKFEETVFGKEFDNEQLVVITKFTHVRKKWKKSEK